MGSLLIVSSVLAVIFAFIGHFRDWDNAGLLSFISGCMIMLSICWFDNKDKPSAMDVYQGKTELRYTVQGGEIVDSVVVYRGFKEE